MLRDSDRMPEGRVQPAARQDPCARTCSSRRAGDSSAADGRRARARAAARLATRRRRRRRSSSAAAHATSGPTWKPPLHLACRYRRRRGHRPATAAAWGTQDFFASVPCLDDVADAADAVEPPPTS